MMRNQNRNGQKKKRRNNGKLLKWLVFCFPAGLCMMWSPQCKWNKLSKVAVTGIIAVALTLIIVPQTLPPDVPVGGVELVGVKPEAEVYGPAPGEGMPDISVYNPRWTEKREGEPVTIEAKQNQLGMVYANPIDALYHTATCEQVRESSEFVSVQEAISAGYAACPLCNPPTA